MVSPKYELLNQIASKVQVLDNPIKLKILAMLVEEGSKSVTDISKDMSLNFSTAHKYLEQLEAAGLVTSKQVSENRLKRIFSIGDFNIDISPHGLSNFLNQKKAEPKKTFKVINERGEEVQFDEKIFSQKYIKRGLPARTISNALDKVAEQAYDGITLLELRELFRQEMAKKLETITNVMEMIEESEIRGRTYYNLLKLNHPEALKMHMDGDIFIQNLGEPKLLNFVHDLRGIGVHGVSGKKPSNMSELFEQVIIAIDRVNVFSKRVCAIDSFNTVVSPFVGAKLNIDLLKKFLHELNNKFEKCFIAIDFGAPKFTGKLLPDYLPEGAAEADLNYSKYFESAKEIAQVTAAIVKNENLQNISLIFKCWDKKGISSALPGTYLVNMTPAWQTGNAAYVGPIARFDMEWRDWARTVRVGEFQNIILNLPKLAYKAKSKKVFFEELSKTLYMLLNCFSDMYELTLGEFHKNYETRFKSVQRKIWDYLHTEDCAYSISIAGLNEAVAILSGGQKAAANTLAQEIIKLISNTINSKARRTLRVQLKGERTSSIIDRFTKINKNISSGELKKCSECVAGFDAKLSASLHKYLLGGHCANLSKEEVLALSDFGLAYVTEKPK